MPPSKLSKAERDVLLGAASDQWELVQPSLPHKFSKTAANGIRQRAGLEPFPVRFQMKHSYNEDFFCSGGLRAAYWAGFIAADGNIHRRGEKSLVLAIGLSRVDRAHLETFLKDLGGGRVYDGTHDTAGVECLNSFVHVSSFKICSDLIEKFNITERKSLTLRPPEGLAEDEILSFIAGYIDGDGCYSFSQWKETRHPNITILGTKEILLWICEQLGYPNKTIYTRPNVFAVKFNGSDAVEVRAKIYELKDQIPLLPRKYKRWEALGVKI